MNFMKISFIFASLSVLANRLEGQINRFNNTFQQVALALCVAILIYNAIQFMRGEGKDALFNSLIGTAIVALSTGIVTWIRNAF